MIHLFYPAIQPSPKTGLVQIPMEYYYNMGLEYDALTGGWVEGLVFGNDPTFQKKENHLFLVAEYTTGTTQISSVTDILTDLTQIKTLWIDWENSGDASGNNGSWLIASTAKTSGHNVFDAQRSRSNQFARTVDSISVASLIGDYYIRSHARSGAEDSRSELKVYRIWGES